MLRWFHIHLKFFAQASLAVAASLWLVAAAGPCVMAEKTDLASTVSHCPEYSKFSGLALVSDCNPVTSLNCQLPDTHTPLTSEFGEIAITPGILKTLPLADVQSGTDRHIRQAYFNTDFTSPPLHIRHLTLLI